LHNTVSIRRERERNNEAARAARARIPTRRRLDEEFVRLSDALIGYLSMEIDKGSPNH
jgi:hypothetical protein